MRTAIVLALVAAASPAFAQPSRAPEVERIRAHLDAARRYVADRAPTNLDAAQRLRRAARLADLDRYIRRGRFPKNLHVPTVRAPYFVDDAGTHCAMAFLIAESGHPELVERVRATANNAYVYELRDDPDLVAWLDTNGMTLDDAAMIQPTYGPVCAPNTNCVCDGYGGYIARPDAVLHVRASDGSVLTVLEVVGTASVAVGDRLTLPGLPYAEPGGTLLLGRYSDVPGEYAYQAIGPVEEGELVTRCASRDPRLGLDAETAMTAIVADDCDAQVVAANPAFEGTYGPDCGGCTCVAVRREAAPAALLLVALVLLFRRQARWR